MQTKVIGVIVAMFMATALFGGIVIAEPPVEEADTVDYSDADVLWELITDLANAPDYAAAFFALPAEAQEAVRSEMEGASEGIEITYSPSVLADHTNCDTQRVEMYKLSTQGWKIATYWSSTYWCWDGDEIVGLVTFTAGGHVAWWAKPWWEYAGHHYKESDFDWANRQWHADRARGHFKECIPIPKLPGAKLCFDSNFSPRIYKWQYADGDTREETE